jgi:hypothetical protein
MFMRFLTKFGLKLRFLIRGTMAKNGSVRIVAKGPFLVLLRILEIAAQFTEKGGWTYAQNMRFDEQVHIKGLASFKTDGENPPYYK